MARSSSRRAVVALSHAADAPVGFGFGGRAGSAGAASAGAASAGADSAAASRGAEGDDAVTLAASAACDGEEGGSRARLPLLARTSGLLSRTSSRCSA